MAINYCKWDLAIQWVSHEIPTVFRGSTPMWSPSWRRPESASVENLRRNKRRMVVFTQCHTPQIHDFYGIEND